MSTLNKYEQLEADLVAQFMTELEDLTLVNNQVFDISPLPDNETEYKTQSPKPIVYVAYDSSDFSDSETLSWIVQEEKIKFSFEIHSKTRRGTKGVLSIFETIRLKILGLKLLGYDRMSLVSGSSLTGGANHWVYYAQFSTITKITDVQPSPDSTGNLLKDAEFINQ